MRVVVTGATSMIGVALIKECLKNDSEVLAIVRKGTKRIDRLPKSKLIKIVYADLDCLDMVSGDGKEYDVFYHLAWDYTSKIDRDNPLAQENNIRTTLDSVKLANKLGCKKYIGAGSQAEYGKKEEVITENSVPNPTMAYGMAKLSANLLSRRMCEQLGMIHVWARIFSVYGVFDNDGTMIDYAIKQFLKGEKAHFSSGNQKWNYLYEGDAGKMLYLLGEKNVEGGIYLIANTESKTLREYILIMMKAYGENAKGVFEDSQGETNYISLEVDITKTIKAIGYTPQISFDEGIQIVINNIRLNNESI